MRALSTRNEDPEKACRPFEKDRDGFVMGEGGAVLILEDLEHARRRTAPHLRGARGVRRHLPTPITSPRPIPRGTVRPGAWRWPFAPRGCPPTDVDYINAHGTSTPFNDYYETLAIKRIFGDRARKAVGLLHQEHDRPPPGRGGERGGGLLRARGAATRWRPPTINYETPDPDCDLDYVPNQAREGKIDCALSNSFGFGGTNGSLLFRKFEG